MKIGRLNRASFAKTARRAMFLFAFAALGAQAAMVAKVGETSYETLDEAITDVQNGETIVVNAGEYKLNGNLTYTGKAFTIQAAADAKVSFDMSEAVALSSAKITFAGVTFDYKTNGNYIGLQHTDTLVYNDCTVNGLVFLYAASETFNRCTFVQEVEDYNVWTYGAKSVTFNDCTFKNVGKTINAYIEGNNALSEPQKIEMADCTVESSKSNKAVVNIKNKTQAYDITLTGKNEVSGIAVNETTKSAWYQVETTDSTDQSCKAVSVTEVKDDGTKDVVYVVKPYVAAFVTVTGIAGFADRKFASFAEAYAAIKSTIEKLGLGEESATADAFDALFTSVDANGNATLTYTISGTVVYDETDCANLLTMGRKASHYGNGRHLINFKFVGATGKDTLTVNSNITLPYEWWGEKTTTGIHFENLTITGSAPSGLYPSQPFFEGIDFSVSKCALKGIKIYNCSNVEGSYTITDSVLDGTGAPADSYAIHLQGNETAPLSINIKGNTISGYDRGINIDQKTAVATIEKNTISVKDAGRSCIQLSSLATADIVGNTLELTGGNAITLHENLLTLSAAPKVSISGNTVTGTGYLIYDDAVANGKEFTSGNLKLTYATDNTVAETVDTTKGVKGSTAYITSTAVNNEVQHYVAQVGTTGYTTLAAAIAALNAENHTLTLLKENAWDAATPVYWAAGTQSGYVKTLTEALTAAYKADAGAITIVCRPGADVGTMTHGHVADDLTIYGNDAFISGGECDLEVDQYKYSRATGAQAADGAYLEKDITITAYELDNLGVWGERHTAHMVTVNLTDCDGKAPEGNVQRVYISGTTGVNNITLTGCDFLTKATAVYSNADGAIKAVNCSFTGGQVPFNINHKANGTQTVAVENCRFTNCGDAAGDWKQFAAPLRLVNSGTGTQSAEVTGCAFAGTVGANGDILLGDGRTGQTSNDVALKVTDTEANIQAQKPGYYGGETVDATKKATAVSPADGTLETSVAKLLPVDPRTLGYATSGKAEALPAAPDMSGEVVNVTAAQAQYVLDGAYGPIDGKTINFTESINDTLILGRASKYDGSKTVYRHGSHAGEALSYAAFIDYKNQSGWTESCFYERTVENVTFTANEGVTVKNFEADGGAHIYAGTAPVYDYVRDTGSWVTEGSCYFKRAILKNITFKGLTFKAKTDINTSESTTVYDGFTFKDCTFDLGTTADGNQAIRYYNENNNGNVKNLVVEGCTFKTCSQGVYTMQVKGITVKDSTFTQTGHNAIAIQSQGGDKGPCNHGEVVITGNTMVNIGDRAIRFNVVAAGTTITITGNTAAYGDGTTATDKQCIKAETLAEGVTTTVELNNWNNYAVAANKPLTETVAKIGTTDYKSLEDATEAAQGGDVITIVGYTSNMTAPDGWKFETADGVTTLVADPVLLKGADGKFHIASCDDLLLFRKMVNEKGMYFLGETVVLDADIDMASVENWTPIGNAPEKKFAGTFDGQNHTISGLKITGGSYVGLFGYLGAATVQNVALVGANVSGVKRVGALVGQIAGNATIKNCSLDATSSVAGSDSNTGGLIGEASGSIVVTLENLTNNAPVTNTESGTSRAAGILCQATSGASVTLKNCVNKGTITTNGGYAGGIVSAKQGGASLVFDGCSNTGTLANGTKGTGALLAWSCNGSSVTISNYSGDVANAIGWLSQDNYDHVFVINGVEHYIRVAKAGSGYTFASRYEVVQLMDKSYLQEIIGFFDYAKSVNNNFAAYPATPVEVLKSAYSTRDGSIKGSLFNTDTSSGWPQLLSQYNEKSGKSLTADDFAVTWGTRDVLFMVADPVPDNVGSEAHPYSREQFAAMTREEYREAQKRLGGTLYVNVGNYAYEKNGVLGNGVRDDTTGQIPDHSELNAYGENGYLGEKNDGANGHAVVFVGGTITSGVTGYTSIDSIGTSLLLAVPAYTKVTFKETTFKNVLSFDYQLYTSPWSQLGGLTFKDCTFDGIIVGAIAAQELAFNGCTFNDYVNTTSPNNSNPTWIRPAYGNWTKGDNEGQGTGFRSLTKITFADNTVTSTRPVKFERIAQWEMATTVTATNNTFAITPQAGDTSPKNVGLYFGANAKFDLVIDNNAKSDETAALYTAVYSAPNKGTYVGLPAGSTVKNAAGEAVSTGDGDALAWKTTDKITLKTTTEVASVTNAKGVANFATLAEAIAAAQAGETVTLLADVESVSVTTVVAGKDIVLDLNGKTLTSTANNGITIEATAKLTVKDSLTGGKVVATGKYSNAIANKGTLVIESGSFEAVYGAIRALGGSTTTISGGTFASSTGRYGMYYWANGTALSVTVNGGLFKNSVSTAMENGKVALSIKGGSFASDLTDYCGADAGTYLDKETGLYVYGRESEHVPAGYVVDENGNVTISDEESLFWFAQQVNVRGNTFKGKTVSLADDIALTAKWTPVGVSVAKSFQGTFDGKDHAITGMKVSGAYQSYGYGFFKLVISAIIKNVTFTQAEVKGEYSNVVGCVAGYSYGSSTFENVHVTDSLVYAFGKVGGFVGMAEDAGATTTFRNCSVEATTIHGGYNVAGFCGLAMGTCAFSGSSLTKVTPIVDEDSQGFGKVVELDTTVACDGSVATCAGTGTSIKGRYIPNGGYYYSAYSDLYNHYGDSKHDCTLADGKKLANSEVVHDAPVAIGDARYSDLQAAFDAAKTGDTVTLLSDITLTEQVNITKALDGLTLDGNGKTIICATTDDPLKSGGGSALYFGNANDHLYCTGIKIKDLTMTGTARFAIFLCGGTTTEFTNVKISGNYYIAVNLYGTHGATMTNCDISNSTKGTDKYISAIWSNVASANPLTLNKSKVDVIAINTYTTANKLEPKIFVMDGSEVGEIHTFDDGSVSGNKKLCVSDRSTGSYVVKEYDEATSTWVNLRVAQIGTVGYETLEAALAAATDGDTITLLADVTVAEQLVVEKPLTLDLGGKTVTSTYAIPASLSSGEARYALLTKAPVTVTNGTFAAGQARALGAYANLTLTDATVTSELIGGHCCVAFCAAGGIYTVANATIKGDYAIANFAHNATIAITGSALEGSGCGLYHNGSNYGLKLTVSDTTINGAIDQAIGEGKDPSGVYLSGSLDVLANAENQNGAKGRHQATFTRCTIKGNTGVEVKYTDLTLEDCTVVATTKEPSYTQNNNGMAALGFAVVSTDNATGNATPKPEGTITITGADGSYTGLVGLGSLDSVKTGFADFEDAHYTVSGGTFSTAVLPEYCAAGFIPTANDDGTYGVKAGAYVAAIGTTGYETLEAALAAAKDGETVKLLADVTESVTIAADRTLTLDLNGKMLSAGKASEALTVTGHLTIDDTSAAKSGRVVGDGRYAVYMNNRTAHVGEAAVGGSLTLNAGSLEGATHGVYILANQAAFTMNGGKVSATQAESIRVNNDYHAKTISLLSGEVGDVFLGSISSTELTTLTVGKADQTDPAAVKVGKIGLQFNTGRFRLELYNGLVGELPEIGPSCTATYTALGMLVKSDANCPSGKVFEAIEYNGETWYRIAALQKIAITFDDSKTVALPFATDWLKAHVGKGEASWTTAALEEKAANGLAKWQCYLFGLDPRKEDAKVVATAGQGTNEAIPLTVANADASASPLVTGGYVKVAYVLMGSNDGTAWTQVATSNKRDGLAIPLTDATYKFYRVDVTVTSAKGN